MRNLIVGAVVAALLALPAAGLAQNGGGGSPGPDAPRAQKARAYGKYCKSESRRRVAGQRASAYARCLNAMAKLGSGQARTAAGACKGLSKKRVNGKRSAHGRCLRAARRLRSDRRGNDSYRDPFDR